MATNHSSIALIFCFLISVVAIPKAAANATTSSAASLPRPKRLVFPFIAVRPQHHRRFQTQDDQDNQTSIKVIGNDIFYLAKFALGNPPQPQTAMIDSGSSLTWVYCRLNEEQEYGSKMAPNFVPYNSTTHQTLGCNDEGCHGDFTCLGRKCRFELDYVNAESSAGFVDKDTLHAGTSDEGTAKFDQFIFGCNHETPSVLRSMNIDGLLGVGPESSSLVSQLGGPLAMCFGNLDTANYGTSYLALGEGVELGPNPTPLSFGFGLHYYVRVTSIFFGQTRLDAFIDKAQVDSGTGSTIIPDVAYTLLRRQISRLLPPAKFFPIVADDYSLCYEGKPDANLGFVFPSLFLNLEGGSRFQLPVESMFLNKYKDHYCLRVRPSSMFPALGSKLSMMIGANAMQYQNIVIDTKRGQMSVEQVDCLFASE